MIISRANLAVAAVASRNAKLPGLNRVHLCADGSTVAANEHILMAVSPVTPRMAEKFPMVESDEASPPPEGVGIPLGLVKDAERKMPRSDQVISQQAARLTRCDEDAVALLTTDGISKDESTAMPMRGKFPLWKALLREAEKTATAGRICVNGKRLIESIQALLKACPDGGDYNMIWIQFGGKDDPLYIRAMSPGTQQHAILRVNPIAVGLKWIRTSVWERGILGKVRGFVKRVVKGTEKRREVK
jgi:hypothetical protein